MAELFDGTLVLKGEGKNQRWFLNYTSRKGKPMSEPIAPDKLSQGLRASSEAEIAVSFELDASGRPFRVRGTGEQWSEPPKTSSSVLGGGQSRARRAGDFHNPYNFIPAPPRPRTGTDLDDQEPAAHDRYQSGRWSGRIGVKLTTRTPLLIVDSARQQLNKDGHKTFHVREKEGKPYIEPTSIKGMLRSAYEAVTNSRMGIFVKHGDRLAYRMPAKIGPVPARVEERKGEKFLRIMRGEGIVQIGFAAKLPRYEEKPARGAIDKGEERAALCYANDRSRLPQHGDAVWVQINRSTCTQILPRTNGNRPEGAWHAGWVCISGPNINRKKYERVFIDTNSKVLPNPLTKRHEELWRELIDNYRETHIRELKKRKNKEQKPWHYLGDKPGQTGWSRHIYREAQNEKESENALHDGTLCYVEFAHGSDTQIVGLIPVTISRRLYEYSPETLLPDSLKPARRYEELSPADRVFGWVNQNGKGAYRGNLRIGSPTYAAGDAIENFSHDGVPLAILGQPKPQQARFYVAASIQGEAQKDEISREEAGYWPNKGLRGRKVYPHHASLPEQYWANPEEDRTQQNHNGFFQEYRRPRRPIMERGFAKLDASATVFDLDRQNEQRDDQNRSVTSWVKPETEFEFQITVSNLSPVELGALLWLFELPEDHYQRLGGGKPLGLGSVSLSIDWDKTDLRDGQSIKRRYSTLDEVLNDDSTPRACINDFTTTVAHSYGSGEFERASFIAAFRRYAKGFNKPVHYPRALQPGQRRNSAIPPHPEGKAFEWFVANERTGRAGGPKLALADLVADEGLPILESR